MRYMKISFKDFSGQIHKAVEALNQFVESEAVRVLNVETIFSGGMGGNTSSSAAAVGVRLWYTSPVE